MGWLCTITGHWWVGSRLNPWGIETEQTCRWCGHQRWHSLDHTRGFGKPDWQDGPHPAPAPKESSHDHD